MQFPSQTDHKIWIFHLSLSNLKLWFSPQFNLKIWCPSAKRKSKESVQNTDHCKSMCDSIHKKSLLSEMAWRTLDLFCDRLCMPSNPLENSCSKFLSTQFPFFYQKCTFAAFSYYKILICKVHVRSLHSSTTIWLRTCTFGIQNWKSKKNGTRFFDH